MTSYWNLLLNAFMILNALALMVLTTTPGSEAAWILGGCAFSMFILTIEKAFLIHDRRVIVRTLRSRGWDL